jgi:hypothetical protein
MLLMRSPKSVWWLEATLLWGRLGLACSLWHGDVGFYSKCLRLASVKSLILVWGGIWELDKGLELWRFVMVDINAG